MNAVTDSDTYETLFASANAALAFAFNQRINPPSSMPETGSGRGKGKGLGGLDGAGQAGMIIWQVNQLDPVKRNIITARFAPHADPCACRSACCSGYRPNLVWAEAIAFLTQRMIGVLSGHLTHHRMRQALVMRYFGERVSFVDVAEQCHVGRDTATRHNERIYTFLKGEERLAKFEIEGRLKTSRVIE